MGQLQESMAAYGFEIHKALVTELRPDAEVAQSMNEINKQKRLRDAALMAAEAEKIRVVKQAEAAADAQYFETLRDIGAQSKAQTVFVPTGPGGVSDIASQIRNGVLQAAAAPTQSSMRA